METKCLSVILFVVLVNVLMVRSYENGPPTGETGFCESMQPNHGDGNTATDPIWEITMNQDCYNKDSTIQVMVKKKTASAEGDIEGFFMQARPTTGTVTSDGVFDPDGTPKTATYDCFKDGDTNKTKNAIGHKDGEVEKESLYIKWKPSSGMTDDRKFVATIVAKKLKYWVKQESPVLRYDATCQQKSLATNPNKPSSDNKASSVTIAPSVTIAIALVAMLMTLV